jgi:hypothetical protein
MHAKWLLLGCLGKSLVLKGGKALLDGLAGRLGEAVFEDLPRSPGQPTSASASPNSRNSRRWRGEPPETANLAVGVVNPGLSL